MLKQKHILQNNKVYIYSSKIQNPKYARYAWKDTSIASLFNKEGLPASTFTTELKNNLTTINGLIIL